MLRDSQTPPGAPASEQSTALRDRLLWICPLVGLVAAAVIVWQFGLSVWSVIVFVFLIACPLVVAWVLIVERRQAPQTRKKP